MISQVIGLRAQKKQSLKWLTGHGCLPLSILIKTVLLILAIEKEVFCKRKKSKNLLIGVRDKDIASLYVFQNVDDNSFEKHQVLETSINDAFRIEKADLIKTALQIYISPGLL